MNEAPVGLSSYHTMSANVPNGNDNDLLGTLAKNHLPTTDGTGATMDAKLQLPLNHRDQW